MSLARDTNSRNLSDTET